MTRKGLAAVFIAILVLVLPSVVNAEITRVEIKSRADILGGRSFGSAGSYELLVGRAYFSVDPANERNRVIVDLDRAPKNAAGRVEFSADLSILRPKMANLGNGIVLLDVVNRGRKTVLSSFGRASASADLSTEKEFGDALLLQRGYTVIWVGWEFDVAQQSNLMRIDVPAAANTTGMVHATFTPDSRNTDYTVGDLAGYRPANPAAAENTLTVRKHSQEASIKIPRDRWSLSGNTVTLQRGFEPGSIYELSYTEANPPVAGFGFAAVRDTIAWARYASDTLVSSKYALAFGSSQSGRFLRDFLYEGFNADEKNRPVFDAVMSHIAGASRIDLNRRWAAPISLAMYSATSFPFADMKLKDPASGVDEGALDNRRARDHQPKIFYTDTDVEYWGGGRVAALIHTSPDGTRDLVLPDNERVYFLAGSQHGPSAFPPSVTVGQQKNNPNNYWWIMRALLVAMEKWVIEGTAPPPSRYPRLQDRTLVYAEEVGFPNLPSVAAPQQLQAGLRAANPLVSGGGAPGIQLPLLVPQVDQDGNDRAGIRLPDIAVPLATYTGWNFRNAAIGGTDQLYPLTGSYNPFPQTKAEREQTHDPRPSIAERYSSREAYLGLVKKAGAALVKDRYLLQEDLPAVVRRAAEHWDLLKQNP